MLYILSQQIFNGTVTMKLILTGVEAEDFDKAKDKVLAMPGFKKFPYTIGADDNHELSFTFPGEFSTWGQMENKPLEII